MAASRSDMYLISQDTTFQHRVQSSLMAASIAIQTESPTSVPFHRERTNYISAIIGSMTALSDAVSRHSIGVATDASVISDATAAGTVVITTGNAATQAALVTDAHIDAAVSGQFNAFFRTPGF